MLFLVNCGGDDNDSSDSSSQENSVTISGTTIPLTLDTEDKIFSQKVLEWNDGNTFSYLEQNKKVMTYLSASGNYSSHSDRDGYWDVRKDNNELWVLFKDGELYRFEVTTDGNNYIQYITRINSDAKLTHLVGEPEQPLLEQIAQDSAADNSAPDSDVTGAEFNRAQTERLRGSWNFVSEIMSPGVKYTFDTSLADDGTGTFYIFDSRYYTTPSFGSDSLPSGGKAGAYIPSLNKFTIKAQLSDSVTFNFTFNFVDDNTIEGTYTGTSYTETFSFHGNRLLVSDDVTDDEGPVCVDNYPQAACTKLADIGYSSQFVLGSSCSRSFPQLIYLSELSAENLCSPSGNCGACGFGFASTTRTRKNIENVGKVDIDVVEKIVYESFLKLQK